MTDPQYRIYPKDNGPRRKFDSGDLMEILGVLGFAILVALLAIADAMSGGLL